LPTIFTPGRIRVEHHDLGGGRFLFTLDARHPWFGRTFHQRCEMRDVSIRSSRPTQVAGERDAGARFRKSMHHPGVVGRSICPWIPGSALRAAPE
jgi:hypothetical protein